MHLKEQVQFVATRCGRRAVGYVDVGCGRDDSGTMAKEALSLHCCWCPEGLEVSFGILFNWRTAEFGPAVRFGNGGHQSASRSRRQGVMCCL